MEEPKSRLASTRRGLRRIAIVLLAIAAVLLLASLAQRSLEGLRLRLLLTTACVSVGAGLLSAVLRMPGLRVVAVPWGLAAIVTSILLVWTEWRTTSLLWRAWWLTLVPSLTFAHVALLRAAQPRRDWIERATPWAAAVTGLLVSALAMRRDLLATPRTAELWVIGTAATAALVGSLVACQRAGLPKRIVLLVPERLRRRARPALVVCALVATFGAGWWIGRVTAPPESAIEGLPSVLRGMSSEQIHEQLASDLDRLRAISDGLDELRVKSNDFRQRTGDRLIADGRDYFTPEEDDEIRALFMTYLSYRSALLRMLAIHAGFEAVRDPDDRARCFLVGYAAATQAYRSGLELIDTYRDDPLSLRKLNEPEPGWGIPAGMYDRIRENAANERNVELCEEMAAYFHEHRDAWRQAALWPQSDFEWLDGKITESLRYVRAHRVDTPAMWLDMILARVRQDAYTPVYAVQSLVAEWIGDTRISQREPFITFDQIESIESDLQPGDVLLERRNWFLSNAFLPGFWPHAALYVGDVEDLRELGIADHPEIRRRLDGFQRKSPDGHANTVIEAVSEGVIFNSLAHSMHADHVAVLRPRVSREERARAIVRAFTHDGKPYDFEFDFFSSDKLVCTEVVYRAYEGILHFDLVEVMGRMTLPAQEIVRKFVREKEREDRELDLILFLDGNNRSGVARRASVDDFCASADRKRGFNR